MSAYSTMKHSVVPWLGMIPEHWEELFLEQICYEKCEKNKDNAEAVVLSLSYGNIIRKKDIYNGLVAKDFSSYQIVKRGDIILRLTDLQNDHKSLRTGLVTQTGIITAAYSCVVPTINSKFLHYLLHSYDLRKVFYGMGGGVRQSIGYKDIRHMKLPVPPREEQDQIVRFLDWKVSKINALINIRKKQLSLLKMRKIDIINSALNTGIAGSKLKDSTIYGLKQIPETWIERSLKYFVTSNDESLSGKTPDDYEIDYIDISTSGFRCLKKEPLHLSFGEAPSRARRIVREGDTILSTVRTYLKSVLYIDGDLDGHVVSTGFSVLRPKKGVYSKLLSYALSCDYFIDSVIRNSAGTSYPAITDKRLLSLKLALPASEDEQKELFEYITKLTATTDDAVASLNAQINGLQSLKERLISDTVTGKIDVRGIEIPEYEFVDEVTDNDAEEDGEENTEEQEE